MVTRSLGANRNPKVLTQSHTVSVPRNHRFLSNFSANPRDEDHTAPPGGNVVTFVPRFEGESWAKGLDAGENADSKFEDVFAIENGDLTEGFGADGAEEIDGEEQSSVDAGEDGAPGEDNDAEKLENLLSLLQSTVDGSFESSLNKMNLDLKEDFVVKVLETPLILGENLIQFFNWAVKKKRSVVTTRVVDALVVAVCSDARKSNAYALWDLVKEVGEKDGGILSVESLNKVICLLSSLGKGKAALEVFNKFGDFGCVPNAETYYFTIEALSKRSFYDWAWSVCEKMLHENILPDNEQVGKIMSWLCKGDKAKDAFDVYVLAKEEKKEPPRSNVNFLINSLCQKDDTVELALKMLDDFSEKERKYAIKSFSPVIGGLCRKKDVDGAEKLLSKMIAQGPHPGNAVFNYIVNGYSKAGDMEKAKKIIKLMGTRGLKPDIYAYTVVISGYANGGQMDKACEVLAEAKKKHSKLIPATYHTLIRGYCKLDEFDKALDLFGEMEEYGVRPNHDEYNKMIQSLCLKNLDWRRAEKLLDEMKGKGLHLNGMTKGLIKAVKELETEAVENEEATIAA